MPVETLEMQQRAQQPTSSEEARKLQKLKDDFTLAEQARAGYEGTWLLNMAFFEGEQWLTYDGNRLCRPKLASDRILITDNRIQPAVRTEIAKMTKSQPSWDATPDGPDEQLVDGARYAERVMDARWDSMKLQSRLMRALEWSRVCGAGFWKITWDSSLGKGREVLVGQDGKVARDPQTEEPLPLDFLEQLPEEMRGLVPYKSKRVHQGDARIDVRSPFQCYPDPLAEGLDECEKFWEKSIVSPTYIKGRYGVDLEPDSEADGGLVQARLSRPGRSGKSGANKRGIVVYEYWEKGSAVNPEGRHVVWSQEKILLDEANPYVDDEGKSVLPYVMFVGIGVPGRFWPTSIVEQLRPLQVELNKIKSQVAENRNRIGNPSLLVSRQATVKYHGVPGERVEFDDTTQNAIPQFLQPPEMPGYVQAEIGAMLEAIRDVAGQHEISSGMVPTGVTAAAAISLLQQQDDTKLGPPTHDMEGAVSTAGQMLMRLLASYCTTEQLVKIGGEDGKFDAFKFKGAMLAGQAGGLRVTPGSMMPRSKSAKQAAMQDMFNLMIQYGVRFDDRALRKFFRSFEVGGLEALLGDIDADERKVNRENRRMYANEPVEVNPLVDNHDAEIAGHREEMKSSEFERADEGVKVVFFTHLQDHLDAQAEQQMQEMMAQMPPDAMMQMGAGGAAAGAGGAPSASSGGEGETDLMAQLAASAAGGGTLPSVSSQGVNEQ